MNKVCSEMIVPRATFACRCLLVASCFLVWTSCDSGLSVGSRTNEEEGAVSGIAQSGSGSGTAAASGSGASGSGGSGVAEQPCVTGVDGDCVCGRQYNGKIGQRCMMLPSDNPSAGCMNPIAKGPSGQSWSCLDNAACLPDDEPGKCKIWCPSENCDMSAHPEGCPQGAMHAVFVDAALTDYEDICRSVCNATPHNVPNQPTRYACWDEACNSCRHPDDCGKACP